MRIIFISFLCVLISACAAPVKKSVVVNHDQKLKVLIDISDDFDLAYVGFTVFTNDFKITKTDWNLAGLAKNVAISTQLSGKPVDYEIVSLPKDMDGYMAGYLVGNGKSDSVTKLFEEQNKAGYSHVLIVKDQSLCITHNCDFVASGHGVNKWAVFSPMAYAVFNTATEEVLFNKHIAAMSYLRGVEYDFDSYKADDFRVITECTLTRNIKYGLSLLEPPIWEKALPPGEVIDYDPVMALMAKEQLLTKYASDDCMKLHPEYDENWMARPRF